MDLSICIVSMNHSKVLKNCLDSIIRNKPDNYSFEVIVVDNCSTDDTFQWLTPMANLHKNIKVVKNTEIKNFAANNNIAIRNAVGNVLLILNPDTLIHPGSLDYMVAYVTSDPTVGAATSKLVYLDGEFQDSARRFITFKYMFFSRLKAWNIYDNARINDEYILSKAEDNEPKEVDYILGACMFIKKEVFDAVGLFDERFLLYAEDTDLCYRIKKQKWKVMYNPKVAITHIYARSGAKRKFSKPAFLQIYTAILFYAKHYWGIVK